MANEPLNNPHCHWPRQVLLPQPPSQNEGVWDGLQYGHCQRGITTRIRITPVAHSLSQQNTCLNLIQPRGYGHLLLN